LKEEKKRSLATNNSKQREPVKKMGRNIFKKNGGLFS